MTHAKADEVLAELHKWDFTKAFTPDQFARIVEAELVKAGQSRDYIRSRLEPIVGPLD